VEFKDSYEVNTAYMSLGYFKHAYKFMQTFSLISWENYLALSFTIFIFI